MSAERVIQLILFGVGGVGQAVVKQILAARAFHAQRYQLQFNFSAVCDSSAFICPSNDTELQLVLQCKQQSKPLSSLANAQKANSPLDIVNKLLTPHTVVIDCSASDATSTAAVVAVERGAAVTFANKKPLSGDSKIFDTLCSPQHVHLTGYESTCGAGTPFIATIQRLLASGDTIQLIQGTFSGTLGYLMSALERGLSYSAAVTDAYNNKYTEPDPRDDLSGMDVARKALILARTMGLKGDLSQLKIEALYPQEWSQLSVDEFMKSLPQLDAEYSRLNAEAQSAGCVLRYVASISVKEGISVGLKALPKHSPLGQLSGTQNMAEFYTAIYKDPLVVQGAGAGVEVTAAGVIADCVQLAQLLLTKRN